MTIIINLARLASYEAVYDVVYDDNVIYRDDISVDIEHAIRYDYVKKGSIPELTIKLLI